MYDETQVKARVEVDPESEHSLRRIDAPEPIEVRRIAKKECMHYINLVDSSNVIT